MNLYTQILSAPHPKDHISSIYMYMYGHIHTVGPLNLDRSIIPHKFAQIHSFFLLKKIPNKLWRKKNKTANTNYGIQVPLSSQNLPPSCRFVVGQNISRLPIARIRCRIHHRREGAIICRRCRSEASS